MLGPVDHVLYEVLGAVVQVVDLPLVARLDESIQLTDEAPLAVDLSLRVCCQLLL